MYHKIEAVADGTATVYTQTKDGKVKTDEITITVSDYRYDTETLAEPEMSLPETTQHLTFAI